MNFWVNFIVAAVVAGTPLLFGTLGEIMNERVGHLNLGVEGMMSLGAIAGFMAGYNTDNFAVAILAAFLAGAGGALIYAIVTVTFMANHTVAGLTLTIFGIGLTNVIGFHYLGMSENGTLKLPETITLQMRAIHITGLSDIPVIGEILFSYNPFVYIGIVIAILLAIFYNRTKAGLNVIAIGENPAAADAAGVHVTAWKYVNIVIGGGICGIGGAFTIMITNGGVWISDCVGGLGWIAVALVIFAAWKPVNAIWGAFVFGAMRILKYYVNKEIIHIPDAFYDMLPFLVTAIILVVVSARQVKDKAQPAACGTNYYREDR